MSDATYEKFINVRDIQMQGGVVSEKKIMNAPSYDITQMSEYHR